MPTQQGQPSMDLLPTPLPRTLYWDNGAGTPEYVAVHNTECRWPAFLKAICPITVLVAPVGSPYATYILNLAVADIITLCCITLILLGKLLTLQHQVAWQGAALLEPISCFSDTVGLCLLTALSVESLLRVLCPTCCQRRRPKHTSAVVCAIIWVLALTLHLTGEVCDAFMEFLACDRFLKGFAVFHVLVFSVMCVSSLALTARDLCCVQPGWASGVCHVVRTVGTSFLLWGLPVIVSILLPEREHVALTVDLVMLLSSVVSTARPALYFFAGYLGKRQGRESLMIAFQRALMSEMVAGRKDMIPNVAAQGDAGPRAGSREPPSLQLCSTVECTDCPAHQL
ncbi:mas-related G-protein coupled receptor MRG-like [Choloepus didactylus]|uniref:mas-related G-protein coupled receptor MRG-like n=1 Tax=Choloepus didactylus TaxID=27675 RepID=UPI00189F3B5B|nr:mas-related G-protein coupled receptor MRG-like [Choloepus didactylus]